MFVLIVTVASLAERSQVGLPGKGVLGSITGSDKAFLGFLRFIENVLIEARSLNCV